MKNRSANQMAMDVHTRAVAAARILDLLGMVVLAIGAISAVICMIGVIWSLVGGDGGSALLCMVGARRVEAWDKRGRNHWARVVQAR